MYHGLLQDKQELWWLYVADKKKRKMISPPQRVSGLRDEFSVSCPVLTS